jgi:hypothetical protein
MAVARCCLFSAAARPRLDDREHGVIIRQVAAIGVAV